MPDVKTEITAGWCRETAAAYEQWAGGGQHEAKLAAALRIAERVLEEGAVEKVARMIDPSPWAVMDAARKLYPADPPDRFKHRESMILAQAIIDYLKGGGDDPR